MSFSINATKIAFALFVSLIYLRGFLDGVGLSLLNHMVIVFGLAVSGLVIIFDMKVRKQFLVLWFYWFYCVLIFIITPLMHPYSNYFSAFIGYASLWLFIPIFYRALNSFGEDFLVGFLIVVGVINAVGAIVQTHFDSNLFGFANHAVYSNSDILSNENVTKRAISFVSSPQSLSLILSMVFCLILSGGKLGFVFKVFFGLIVFYAGLLTVSKAFFLYIFVFFFFISNIGLSFFGFLGGVGVLLFFPDYFVRIIDVVRYIQDVEQYSAFSIWLSAISYSESWTSILLGNGMGLLSRGAQSLGGYSVLGGSAESFFIQLYLEIGIVGVLIFLMLNVWVLLTSKADKHFKSCLVAFLVVGMFTPALYGFSVGLFYYAILSVLIFNRGNSENICVDVVLQKR